MKPPSNIYGPAISAVSMAMLLLGDFKDPPLRYAAFGLLIVSIGAMTYWYQRAISEKPGDNANDINQND